MKTNLFIPKKINVGFQERKDTYTQKLAYVIYYDNNGVLRKEKSWNSWRNQNIPNEEFDNVPTEGFVLNKHAGGHKSGWDYRQSYIRVYDPRNFEFEITVDNLLYILENCNCIKGKGIEGKFVYAWNGTELVLLPVDSVDYKDIVTYNETLEKPEKITNSTLVPGYTYLTTKNKELLYLGRYDYFNYNGICENKKYIFANLNTTYCNSPYSIEEFSSINKKFIKVVSSVVPNEFSEYLDKLERSKHISPIDESKSVYTMLDYNTFVDIVMNNKLGKGSGYYFCLNGQMIKINGIYNKSNHYCINPIENDSEINVNYTTESSYHTKLKTDFSLTLKSFYDKFGFYNRDTYLKNGNLYCNSGIYNYW